ncbi:aspartyl aminopeptidase-like protein [Bisporella sp. PMI_857]|nr:aspartyl aminopeptidase-like protein [Bisporella sp. PMI_857]
MFTRSSLLFQISSRAFSSSVVRSCPTTKKELKMTSKDVSSAAAKAHDFIDFVNDSPTPYHAVHSAIQRLAKAGFEEIKERDSWSSTLQPGGKYYLTRNGSSIVAFGIGKKWKAGNPIAMIGAHTDSCCLRIKPVSKKSGSGFLQVGVETYGGGLWHTWFDRDLSIAGRVMVKDGKGNYQQKLIKVERPILRIPTLAIHLNRQTNFDPNKETELFPIAGLVAAELNRTGAGEKIEEEKKDDAEEKSFQPLKVLSDRHHPYIVEIIAEHAEVGVEDVVDFEVVLYDVQKGCIGGINNEFIYSARLDNLGMTYTAVEGLIESVKSETALDNESSIRLITCFDHEEIGSTSAQGAASNFLPAVVRRLSVLPAHHEPHRDSGSERSFEKIPREPELDIATAYEQTLSGSFLISADMAHSVNPNYTQKYEADHRPEMNKGTVIKINANQRYATNSPGIVLIQEVARRAKPSADSTTSSGVPLQLFVVRNDSSCGSTIGPMLSAALGTRTLDLGNAQLSMHSIRETGGVYDVEHAIRLFESFFEHFSELEAKIFVD